MKKNINGSTPVEWMVIAVVGVLLAVILAPTAIGLLGGMGKEYSTGTRAGVVTKLSEKGVIWKSWEGELNMGGVKTVTDSDGNNATVANVFTFNVAPECVEKVQAAMISGNRVSLVYRQWLIKPTSIDNRHVVIGVKDSK